VKDDGFSFLPTRNKRETFQDHFRCGSSAFVCIASQIEDLDGAASRQRQYTNNAAGSRSGQATGRVSRRRIFYGLQEIAESRRCSKGVALVGRTSTTKSYLESLGGSLLSPMKDLPVKYGKYTDYLKPMLDDLAVTPQWAAEDLARPELNLLQNDSLDELILYSTGRMPLEDTISRMDKLGASFLEANQPVSK
jgi:hypothetical protein